MLEGLDVPVEVVKRCVEVEGCCPYCALACAGVHAIGVFQEAPEALLAAVRKLTATPTLAPPTSDACSVCAGIIPLCHTAAIRSLLCDGVQNCGYQFTTYRLTIHIPTVFLIRQHALTSRIFSAFPELTKRNEEDLVDTKRLMKWILGPHMDATLGTRFDHQSPFLVDLHVHQPQLEAEGDAFLSRFQMSTTVTDPRTGRIRTTTAPPNAQTAQKFLDKISDVVFARNYSWPPPRVAEAPQFQLLFSHLSAFVVGRYCKYAAKLFQTPFDGRESSVQELIALPLLADFGAKEYKFSASGREDSDVRMLGDGRPFAIEFIDPHRALHITADFEEMQRRINASTQLVQVSDLQPSDSTDSLKLKDNETRKIKHYRALVWSSRELTPADFQKLEAVHDLAVAQKTPIRVLHRRSLMVRDKIVHELRCEQLSRHFFVLFLKTSAGTYIKEFVHGDLGRTSPNVSSILGCTTDILQLDVMQVEAEFPPKIRPAPKLEVAFSLPESFLIADREHRETSSLQPPPQKRQETAPTSSH